MASNALNAPTCKVCGSEHRFGDPHVWKGAPETKEAEVHPKVSAPIEPGKRAAFEAVKTVIAEPVAAKRGRGRPAKDDADKFDRAAYMRAYRAKAKTDT